jgi:hypothetical protein
MEINRNGSDIQPLARTCEVNDRIAWPLKKSTIICRSPHPRKRSIIGMWNIKDRASRCRMWEQAFTPKALAEFQYNADALLDELIGNLDKVAKAGILIDMSEWLTLYSFDGKS